MNLDLYVVLAGVAAALLTSLVKRESWSVKTKQSVNAGLALVGGLAALYLKAKGIDAKTVAGVAATSIFGISQGTYAFILKGTKLDAVLTAVGNAPIPTVSVPTVDVPAAVPVVEPATTTA